MLYLVLYNGTLSLGWAYVLYLTLGTSLKGGGGENIFQAVGTPLKVVQTAAVLEVVHSLTGVVRSPVFTTAIQVVSRIWALWGIVSLVPEATTQQSLQLLKLGDVKLQLNIFTLLVAWSISEVLRYSFYVFKETGVTPPYVLLWLRYSAFIVLYPLGVGSELTMAYLALPTIKATRPLSVYMPNSANFSFDYYTFCLLAIVAYIPGLPQLYLYMLSQRRKLLGNSKGKTS